MAVTSGIAVEGSDRLGGVVVRLYGDDGVRYYYAHLNKHLGYGRKRVAAGDVVGPVGNTGNATGITPHLHFGKYVGGKAVNPYPDLVHWCRDTAIPSVPGTDAGDDVVWAVTGCGALAFKGSYWAPWVTNMDCGQASQVALSPDGNTIFVITPDGRLVGKHGTWGSWEQHLGGGDARSVAVH